MVRGIPHTEKLFIGGDFNGHIEATSEGYDDVYGGFGFGDRKEGGTSLLDFARAFDLVIANSSFPKKREHLVTFRSSVAETQIDYLLCRKSNRGICTNGKCIREAADEVLGVSKGYSDSHKGDWWWNGEVQGKVEIKKVAYLKLVVMDVLMLHIQGEVSWCILFIEDIVLIDDMRDGVNAQLE
uniref:Craniofacial development protein 2-like n=1 Tax=Nicotiana tabacum TaxID=4097 RepID=A0A1S3XI24_TOBAC